MRVRLLQSRAKLCETVPVLACEYLQEKSHFFRVGGAAVSQFVAFRLAQGPAVSQNLHNSVRVCYGLHQVLVTFLQQLFMLWLHLDSLSLPPPPTPTTVALTKPAPGQTQLLNLSGGQRDSGLLPCLLEVTPLGLYWDGFSTRTEGYTRSSHICCPRLLNARR